MKTQIYEAMTALGLQKQLDAILSNEKFEVVDIKYGGVCPALGKAHAYQYTALVIYKVK